MDIELKGIKLPSGCKSIDEIRNQIDNLDRLIIRTLGVRYQFVKEIVKYKNKDFESIKAQDRYEAVLKQRRTWAESNGLDPDIIENIYKDLIHYFIDEEMKLITNEKRK